MTRRKGTLVDYDRTDGTYFVNPLGCLLYLLSAVLMIGLLFRAAQWALGAL